MDDLAFRILRLRIQGYCCSQIMIVLALQAQGKTNADLVRAAGGLCNGAGESGEICGAFSGGACIISMYAGKGTDEETADDHYSFMVNELMEWADLKAKESYGDIKCEEILRQHPDKTICGQMVLETYEKVMDILEEHGFDPGIGRSE